MDTDDIITLRSSDFQKAVCFFLTTSAIIKLRLQLSLD